MLRKLASKHRIYNDSMPTWKSTVAECRLHFHSEPRFSTVVIRIRRTLVC